MCSYRYILLNCNLSDSYAISREIEQLYMEALGEVVLVKNLRNYMHDRASMLKHSSRPERTILPF
ncbi:hypothetical protein H8356DRAFT_1357983 [Neocallimastix lanati (nom. inval.)]|nr:hypothetical protein H8356DRAFT_1357983 [Neocallimastix sp. JGI-2020a]